MTRLPALPSLLVLALAWGCNCDAPPAATAPAATEPVADDVSAEVVAEETEAAPDLSTDYGRELHDLTRRLEAAELNATRFPDQWMRVERVAGFYAERARLTGSFDDYGQARETVERAFEMAPERAGPFLMRASVNFAIHRIAELEPDLAAHEQRVNLPQAERAEIIGMRGDVAFHSGRFEEAARLHRESDAMSPSTGSAFRIAYDLWQSAQFDEAERWLGVAEGRRVGPATRPRAWMDLQRGLMNLDRGRYDEALAHYQHGVEQYSGWWLLEEHIAEIHMARGELETAARLYRDVVERTGNPELMDNLATVLEASDPEASRQWRERARVAFEAQLEQLPEAAYGHALDHFLEHGEPARALELAEANYALRPGGDATVKLAQALLGSDRAPDALARIEPLLSTPYRTADLHATASAVYEAVGDAPHAAEQRARALEINPHAFD